MTFESVFRRFAGWWLTLAFLGASSPMHAQLTLDGTTTVFNGTITNITGNVVVGTNSPNTVLILTNFARMTNSGSAIIGFNTASDTNRATLTGVGTRWVVGGALTLGRAGSDNVLVISNAAFLSSASAIVGQLSSASNNTATITGNATASVWTNSGTLTIGSFASGNRLIVSNNADVFTQNLLIGDDSTAANNEVTVTGGQADLAVASLLHVGDAGSNNRLWITNNGVVQSGDGRLGFAAGSDNNRAVVDGSQSAWNLSGALRVGSGGAGNQLLISGGGTVSNTTGVIGRFATASNNSVTVSGSGSTWRNSSFVSVGEEGAASSLLLTNNGTVLAGGLLLGAQATSTNNRLTVAGGTLRVTNASGTAVYDLRRGTNVLTSGTMDIDLLVMTNNEGRFIFNGGTLITRGGTISNGQVFSVGTSGSAAANLEVQAGASLVVNDDFTLGANTAATGNRLLITNGGTLSVVGAGYIGTNSTASNNMALVTGAGSLWTNSGILYVGEGGSGNQLEISNGGTLGTGAVFLGNDPGAHRNVAVVTGADSQWSTPFRFDVGKSGSWNRLVVSNGGFVRNSLGFVGYDITASNNLAVVTGSGSRWVNGAELEVGSFGSGNQLVVSNGGFVRSRSGTVGESVFSSNNVAVVTGAGSMWTNVNNLSVGTNSSGNRLVVSDGGRVHNISGSIGHNASANDNEVIVTGAGSLWTNSGILYVGYNGSGNRLVVSNAGAVHDFHAFIGYGPGASNNVAVVTGDGSIWGNSFDLTIGQSGSGNQLLVSNGGTVHNRFGLIDGTSNVVVVTGAGSLWTNTLTLSFSSSESQLVVSDGGSVRSGNGRIGYSGSNNVVVVTGPNSSWTNGGDLQIGMSGGDGNRLVVSNGGFVRTFVGDLGNGSGSRNNMAVVAGAGSLWSIQSDLYVGSDGSGSQLVVSNGGTVSATNVTVGAFSSSTNNRVAMDGGNLFATNRSGTGTLDIRRGTNVLNSGLIVVDRLLVTNGALSRFEFNGGTLKVGSATVSNGIPLTVGNGTSSATLDFTGNGTRTFGSGLVIRSNATMSFSAGVLNSSGITNRNGAPFIIGNGTSNAALNLLGNGTHTFANNLIVSSNAQLTGNGTLFTTSVASFGTIAPGNSAGALNIATNLLLFDSAKLTFEIGGLIATNDYDRINVGSLLQMAGTLSLELINNFLPEPEHTFTLLTFGTQSGSFTNIMGGRVSLTNNLASFAVTQTATNLQLSGVTYVDTDGDGQGDLQELAAGTDPNVSASYLQITSLTQNGSGHYVIQFQSVSGKSYRIEWTDNFVTWNSVLSPVLTTPAPGVSQWIDDGTLTGGLPGSRTYRVGLR